MTKQISIEYLYLDRKTCTRCMETEGVLENVISVLTPALELTGYDVILQKVEIENEEMAVSHHFLSSPTVRVDGKDIFQSIEENSCGCCSDISGTDVDCRAYTFNGETYETPPAEMLAHAILDCVFNKSQMPCSHEDYSMPENLKTFFAGKKARASCSCSGECC